MLLVLFHLNIHLVGIAGLPKTFQEIHYISLRIIYTRGNLYRKTLHLSNSGHFMHVYSELKKKFRQV